MIESKEIDIGVIGLGLAKWWMESRLHWLTPCGDEHDFSYLIARYGKEVVPKIMEWLYKAANPDEGTDPGKWYVGQPQVYFDAYEKILYARAATGEKLNTVDSRLLNDSIRRSVDRVWYERTVPYLFYGIAHTTGLVKWPGEK